MRIRVLGAAAGGAFPQWNCSCLNCKRLRRGRFEGSARSQTQLAVSVDSQRWFLLNASPDLRYQLESFPLLHPSATPDRNSPVEGIVLLSAEIDAALGLLLLRECQPLRVYSTESVRRILTEDNSVFGALRRCPDQIVWTDVQPGVRFPIAGEDLFATPISTHGGYPSFVSAERKACLRADEAVIALYLEHNGARVGFFPGVSRITEEWLEDFNRCDAILFDGTFWSEHELGAVHGAAKPARDMGHLVVEETLAALSGVRARKIFIHVNNTNPILDQSSREYKIARDAGWEIAWDGMELTT